MTTRWASLWTGIRRYLERLADATSATRAEAREGRSYSRDYKGLTLDGLLTTAKVRRLPLGEDVRYAITSDHHRKATLLEQLGHGSARIAAHRALYQRALQFYAQNGYTLIEAGDMEELWRLEPGVLTWMEAWDRIQYHYASVYRVIREEFVNRGRYVRLWGNHDAVWRLDRWRHRYLTPVLGERDIYEMALIGGRYLVMHGQAVDRWNNDRIGWLLGRVFSKTFVHIDAVWNVIADPDGTYPNYVGGRRRNDWLARIQRKPWIRRIVGKQPYHFIRAVECDACYVKWARQLGVKLICGHTHEPSIFPSDSAGGDTPYLNCGSGLGDEEMQVLEIFSDGTPVAAKWTTRGREELLFRPAPGAMERDGSGMVR